MASASSHPRLIAESKEEKIPERLLAKFWKERAARQTGLRTEAGKRVRVVYPGRSGVTAGPDFRDALLEVEGVGLVRGDVELHLRQQDWDSHGHGGDPNYNGVVVHGALEVFSTETRLQSGSLAPVMDLRSLLTDVSGPGPALDLWRVLSRKGFHRPGTLDEAEKVLDRAGDQRFLAKSRWLVTCIRADGPDQALYQALMEGLGYASNRRPFLALASAAPYRAVSDAASDLPPADRFAAIRNWLTDCSGLDGPLNAGSPRRRKPRGVGPAMDGREWRLFRVRPANHPRRRIMGAALLLERFLETGLAAGLHQVVEELSPPKLTGALTALSQDGPAFVGRGRAKDLAVNAVLPFMHAWDETGNGPMKPGVKLGAPEALYRKFPLLSDNEITREMTDQLLPVGWRGAVTNARRQQGLLHLSALLKGAF
jgi:hypothetical protein